MQIISIIGGCISEITGSHGLMAGLLLAGLVGGTTHCVSMCGPFVLSQTGHMKKLSDIALFPYHLGRMTTYMFLAFLTYSVFHLVFVFSGLKVFIAAPMLMTAAVIFLISAFPRLGVLFPWAARVNIGAPAKLINKIMPGIASRDSGWSQYLMGVLLGFMPCGLIIAALLAVGTADSLFHALTAMALFSLGTVPSLIAVALGGKALHHKFPDLSDKMSKTVKCASAFWLFLIAGTMVF
jgi:hypothetical protein